MTKRIALILFALLIAGGALAPAQTPAPASAAAPQMRHISPELQKKVETTNYKEVRTKKFPFAMQAWTFRRFTFLETLAKLKELGVGYLQAYPGQALGAELPNFKFDHNMTDATMATVKAKLKEAGVAVVAYGVCDIGKTEASMRQVFAFARKMGFRTVVCEPADDDFACSRSSSRNTTSRSPSIITPRRPSTISRKPFSPMSTARTRGSDPASTTGISCAG
jgi:hypothetical protein